MIKAVLDKSTEKYTEIEVTRRVEDVKNERENLIQAFRQKKLSDDGKKKTIKKDYLNKDKWIQITDPFIFLEIFPSYLSHIADEIDEWYIFVKKTYKALLNCNELETRKKELLNTHMVVVEKNAFKWGVTNDSINKMSYFEFYDLLIKHEVIKEKNEAKKVNQVE